MILNKLKGSLRVAVAKAPAFGDNRKFQMEDIGILCGGTVIDTEIGMSFETAETDILGSAKKVILSKDDTIIINGLGEQSEIKKRVEHIRSEMESATSEYDKEKLQERQAKLSGGVGVIKVGGATEVEVKEIKDRLNDALQSTRCALDEGILIGGGAALLYASQILKGVKLENLSQQYGLDIIKKALQEPIKKIISNAGQEGAVIVEKLLELKDHNIGYDAYADKIVNMKE